MKLPRHNLSNDVRTSSTSMNGRENSEPIPYDLIYELLLRLPAKSIARFRCVSKLWASILRRHDFTELFLTRSSTRQQLLFVFRRDSKLSFFTAPQNPDNNSSLVVPDYHMKFTCVESSFHICGHVRGLVCVTHHQNVKGGKYTVLDICNPSTRQSLPLSKVKTKKWVSVLCFFAYDPIGKQFKVLSVTWPCNVNLPCKEYKILTLGRRKLSWRMIECSVPHHPTSRGICINGCLYYHSIVDRVDHHYLMVCFDVTSEKFTFIRKPIEDVKWNQSILVNYNGKLATLTSDRCGKLIGRSRYIELWVIADAEKHEWSKHIFELPSLWKDVVHSYSYFIGISGANEIMLSSRDSSDPFDVFYYNFARETIRKVKILGMDALKHSRMDTFLHHVEDVKLM